MNRRSFLKFIPKAGVVAAALPIVAQSATAPSAPDVVIPDAYKPMLLADIDIAPEMSGYALEQSKRLSHALAMIKMYQSGFITHAMLLEETGFDDHG